MVDPHTLVRICVSTSSVIADHKVFTVAKANFYISLERPTHRRRVVTASTWPLPMIVPRQC
jgi:hypothetical protein